MTTDYTTANRCEKCGRALVGSRCLHCQPMPGPAAILLRRFDGDAVAALEEAGRIIMTMGAMIEEADTLGDRYVSAGLIRRGRHANAVDEREFRDGKVEAL